ncbi:MAG: murein L,D-transpeptidase [Caulobacteraceae bacterium]|nr:murein L,D-transpeptidase [Caulobacteraceae bacterium]
MNLRFLVAAMAVTLSTTPLAARAADQDALGVQVALDVAGFSPAAIDGRMGKLTVMALSGFQAARGLEVTGLADAPTLQALAAGTGSQSVTLTEADVAGPFVKRIPASAPAQAKLKALSYTSVQEALAEKYHTTPALLRSLNPGASFAAGSTITVPAVALPASAEAGTTDWDAALASLSVAKTQPKAARIIVDKSEKNVRVYDAAGALIAQFPATLGSSHDPLPLGDWKILGVSKLPPFNYDPNLFWDAKPKDAKAKLPPGPNGPVGVVWIDLSKDHYGIHGTPNPESIGRAESHGCIRLTNWDAARLAQMVSPSLPITLQD